MFFKKNRQEQERESRASEYDDMESIAMSDELQALDAGDHEEADFYDLLAGTWRDTAARIRRGD